MSVSSLSLFSFFFGGGIDTIITCDTYYFMPLLLLFKVTFESSY
jgi:hypothetical protein